MCYIVNITFILIVISLNFQKNKFGSPYTMVVTISGLILYETS